MKNFILTLSILFICSQAEAINIVASTAAEEDETPTLREYGTEYTINPEKLVENNNHNRRSLQYIQEHYTKSERRNLALAINKSEIAEAEKLQKENPDTVIPEALSEDTLNDEEAVMKYLSEKYQVAE